MKTFYATTPIYYVNDLPHIGHIYTTVVADTATRYHRLVGEKTRFLTGTEEIGEERKCPVHGTACAWESEENIFFRLSKYAAPLLDHYERHPEFVRPETRRAEMMSFMRGGLTDLSVSRSKVQWGIPFPGRPGQVVYVWLDALANYITALGFGSTDDSLFQEFWASPEGRRVHRIVKAILRFH